MVQDKKIAIISSNRFIGRIQEDIWLREALLREGENAEIVSWEDPSILWSDYKTAILRSAWGYHRNVDKFTFFLKQLEESNVQLFNDAQIVRWNIQKDLQFEDLANFGINVIPTVFVKNHPFDLKTLLKNFSQNGKIHDFVIKPIISGSGENTFFISLDEKKPRLKNEIPVKIAQNMFYTLMHTEKIKGLMIQPFLPGITRGEFSFIFIDSYLTHSAIRYPGIFTKKKEPEEISLASLPLRMINFAKECQKVLNLISRRFQSDPIYTRCDIIENDGKYFLMEAEMAEPDLLIKTISSTQQRNDTIRKLISTVLMRSR